MSANLNTTDIDMKNVTDQANILAGVLKAHGVFGTVDEQIEAHDFICMVEKHVLSNDNNVLELTYRNTNVRILIRTKVLDNTGVISRVQCIDHPTENPNIDYKKLSDECNLMLVGW